MSSGGYTNNYTSNTYRAVWVNGRCVMSWPIAEPDSLDNAIKIKALSKEPGNTGWTISPACCKLLIMGNLDDIQFQPILQDIADDTVVMLGASNQPDLQKQNSMYNKQP